MAGKLCRTIIVLLVPVVISSENVVRVSTKFGVVLGNQVSSFDKDVNQFLGIPYAKKAKRFANPEPLDSSEAQELDARQFKPPCLQVRKLESCEDCLYLNIWSPATDATEKAVMVYLHGGGFNWGTSSTWTLNGTILAARGDVVIVTLNYRLGFTGFLVSSSNATNVGFKDQQIALQWVKENIKNFGGDPTKVTLFGHSAGSIAVSIHLLNPSSNGLFMRAIMQSGSPSFIRPEPLDVGRRKSLAFSKYLNCSTDEDTEVTPEALQCLSTLPSEVIATYGEGEKVHSRLLPNPVRGDSFIIDKTSTIFSKPFSQYGLTAHPLLIGFVGNEGMLFVQAQIPKHFKKDSKITFEEAKEIMQKLYKGRLEDQEIDKVTTTFLNDSMTSDELKSHIAESYGELMVYCPSLFYAREYQKSSGGQVYAWSLESKMSKSFLRKKCPGVCHGEEEPFVFGHPFLNKKGNEYSERDKTLSLSIMDRWSHFAKTGIVDSDWKGFKADNPTYHRLDDLLDQSHEEKMWRNCLTFWKDIFENHQ